MQQVCRPDGTFYVLGIAINAVAPSCPVRETLSNLAPGDGHGIAAAIREWTGTYAVVGCTATNIAVYTDAAGLETVYYGGGRAASTPLLLPGAERDERLDAEFRVNPVDDWYPGSTCPYRGVKALLANHRLDVDSGNTSRFWPFEIPTGTDRPAAISEIATLLRNSIEGLRQVGPILSSLTGGKDTRICLAASRSLATEIEYFTVRARGVRQCDLAIPESLAKSFNLAHQFVDNEAIPSWLAALYDEMSGGMSVGARRDILGACRLLASDRYVHVNGNLGAMAKKFFWPSPNPRTITIEHVLRSFASSAPCIRSGLSEWLATVPQLPAPAVYNLLYLEQRGGRWEGVGENASKLFYDSLTPFCNRRIFELISSLSPEDQGHPLLVDIVRELWPDLLSIPYCRPSRKWTRVAPKALRARVRKLLHR